MSRLDNLLVCLDILKNDSNKTLDIRYTRNYTKSVKKISNLNKQDHKLILMMEEILSHEKFRGILIKELGVNQYRTIFVIDEDAHPLSPDGRYIEDGDWSVHVKSDLVIVYRYETDNTIKLVKLKYVGSHLETHTKESVIGKVLKLSSIYD